MRCSFIVQELKMDLENRHSCHVCPSAFIFLYFLSPHDNSKIPFIRYYLCRQVYEYKVLFLPWNIFSYNIIFSSRQVLCDSLCLCVKNSFRSLRRKYFFIILYFSGNDISVVKYIQIETIYNKIISYIGLHLNATSSWNYF